MKDSSAQTTTTHGKPPSSEKPGRTLALERRGIAHVPTDRRYGNPRNQFTVRFAPVIYLAGIYLGASGGPLGLRFNRSGSGSGLGQILRALIPRLFARDGPPAPG